MGRRLDRRELLVAGFGLWTLGRPPTARAAAAGADAGQTGLQAAGAWAERALATFERSGASFAASSLGAVCDLGTVGRLEVASTGTGAVRVTLAGHPGELEILRTLASSQVARVEARMVPAVPVPAGRCYDVLRRVPGGFELTFSSALALRHAEPERRVGEPPVVYERLAAAAVDGARSLLL